MTEPAIITWHQRIRFTANSSRPLSDEEIEMVKAQMRASANERLLLMDEEEWAVSPARTSVGGATSSPMFKPMPIPTMEEK